MRHFTDDRLHAQLNKGHRPSQTQIDMIARGVGRTAFGACQVQEIESRSALTDFTMGDMVSGVAWSLNPYVGCLHSCRYCFVPQTLHVERARWGSYVLVKHNLPNVLRRELEEYPRLTVFVSTSTDPYQPVEQERRVTRNCLRMLARKDWPVDVLTRSPLVLRDLDILKRFRRLRVGMSVPTLDEEARRLIEPNAPPIKVRLETLRTLADEGLTTYANYTPAYPPTRGFTAPDIARAFKEAGVRWVNTSSWKYQAGYLARLWDDTQRTEWTELARFVGNKSRQRVFRRQLDHAFRTERLPLRTGFFNQPFPTQEAAPVEHRALDDPALQPEGPVQIVAATRPCS